MGTFPEESSREGLGRTLGQQMKDEIMKRKIWIINQSVNLSKYGLTLAEVTENKVHVLCLTCCTHQSCHLKELKIGTCWAHLPTQLCGLVGDHSDDSCLCSFLFLPE